MTRDKEQIDCRAIRSIIVLLFNNACVKSHVNFLQFHTNERAVFHAKTREEDDKVVAIMGYRYFTNLAWEKFLYIDDLCSLPTTRKRGNGGTWLDYAKEEAWKHGCKQVHLDSGYQRLDAHRLYLDKGFFLMAHHFQYNL
jgi:GNAT superfamily N-acetyltransferase